MYKFLFLFFFSFVSYSQQEQKIDSLFKGYSNFKNSNLKIATSFAYKTTLLVEKQHHKDSTTLKAYNNYIEVLYKQRKNKEAKEQVNKMIKLATKLNHEKFLCLSYLHLGNLNIRERKYNQSLKYFEQSIELAKKNKFITLEHRILNSKAILLKRTKNNKKAITLLKKTIHNKKFNNPTNLGYSYNSLAGIYFKNLLQKDSSAYFYNKGIDIIKNTNNVYLKTILYLNLGDLFLQTDDSQKGVNYLLLAKETALKCNNYKVLYQATSSLGIYHHGNKEYSEAIEKYEEAKEKYGKHTDKRSIAHLYWLLSEALYLNNQPKEAYLYQEKLINLKDSLFTIEKNKTFEKLQTEYEVEKKNDQIRFLEKEKVLEAKRKKLVFGIGGLLVFILGLLAFVYRYKVNSQKLILKQEQKLHTQEKQQLEHTQRLKHIEGFIQGEEKEKNRIAIELHDGIGGKLAGVKHLVSVLSKTKDTTLLAENLTNITKEVRLLSHSLSYTYSLQKPLKHLLEELQEQYKNHFSIEVVLYPENEIDMISDDKKLFIYRSIQELVNNSYKYAKADNLSISLTATDELLLMVEDDGVGFNIHNTANGIGLQNIKEKLVKFKGELHIDTVVNRGTTIIIKLPK